MVLSSLMSSCTELQVYAVSSNFHTDNLPTIEFHLERAVVHDRFCCTLHLGGRVVMNRDPFGPCSFSFHDRNRRRHCITFRRLSDESGSISGLSSTDSHYSDEFFLRRRNAESVIVRQVIRQPLATLSFLHTCCRVLK